MSSDYLPPDHHHSTLETSLNNQPLLRRLSLFWQLFLSVLILLLITTTLSTALERWLNAREITSRMQVQVSQLSDFRQTAIQYLEVGDTDSIEILYNDNRWLSSQMHIIDEHGDVLFPKFNPAKRRKNLSNGQDKQSNKNHHLHDNYHRQKREFNERQFNDKLVESRQINKRDSKPPELSFNRPPAPNIEPNNGQIIQQLNSNFERFPELQDTTVISPDAQLYTIRLYPKLSFEDILSSQKSYPWIRIAIIILFSMLACYLLSLFFSKRIRRVQNEVHRLIEGNYEKAQKETDIAVHISNDELQQLAADVSTLSNRLFDSEMARKQMLSDISHELRSPLARLEIATELTRDFAPQADRYIDRIEKESARMNELIGQIIHIQSLQMQRYANTKANFESVNLLMLVSDIRGDVDFEFQDKSLGWLWQLDGVTLPSDDTPPIEDHSKRWDIKGNKEQLHSALENIIRNAYIHTNNASTITVQLNHTTLISGKPAISIKVIDSGQGIKHTKDLQTIFRPFVRLDKSRTRYNTSSQPANEHKDGYGLGLAIAHAIVTAHNGTISAYNRLDETTGLVVDVTLPIR